MPGLGLIIGFIGIVITMAISQSLGYFNFAGESSFTVASWGKVLTTPFYWRTLFYSARIGLFSALFAVAAAYPIALWLRKPFPGSGFLSAMLKVPMLIPGLVAAFLYVNLISHAGFINYGLMYLGIISEPLRMRNDEWGIGVLILQVWKNLPFALLLLSGSVRAIRDDILDAAQDLGAHSWSRFCKIVAPLTLRSLQAAMAIIFIGAVGDYSFQVIAGPLKLNSLAQYMLRLQSISWADSAVVAVSLMVLSLAGAAIVTAVMQLIIKAGQK